MHEMAICQALLKQIDEIATRENAKEITQIVVRVGPLSGVVPDLLVSAFTIARAGTIAADAELITEDQPIRVRCQNCGTESTVSPNKLICASCGDYRTQLLAGDELLLASVELNRDEQSSVG